MSHFPKSPRKGERFFRIDARSMYRWSESEWKEQGQRGMVEVVFIGLFLFCFGGFLLYYSIEWWHGRQPWWTLLAPSVFALAALALIKE